MITESALERDARQRQTLDRLLAEKNLGRYATFFETGEGTFMRDGLENMTGYVIDATGQTRWFVLGWDAAKGSAALLRWRRVGPKPSWNEIAEYRRARESVDLPV